MGIITSGMDDFGSAVPALGQALSAIAESDPGTVGKDNEANVYVLGSDGWTDLTKSWVGDPEDPWARPKQEPADQESVEKGILSGTGDDAGDMFGTDILTPMYDPAFLWGLVRTSSHIRPCIDAYRVGCETQHLFDPTVDTTRNDNELRDEIRGALSYEKLVDHLDDDPWFRDPGDIVTDAEIERTISDIKLASRIERYRLEHVFNSFATGSSLIELRRNTRTDQEVTGCGYWEILRVGGAPRYATWARSVTIRPVRSVPEPVTYQTWERISGISIRGVERTRMFRRWVQRSGSSTRYFKEFGDPRLMDARTGRYHVSLPKAGIEASEIYDWPVVDPQSPVGCPRWAGVILAVQGAAAAERVNVDYFQAKPPAGILLVSGTRLGNAAKTEIQRYWNGAARGEERFHGLVVIEALARPDAMPGQASGKIAVEYKPLTDTQHGDALFREYDRETAEKVGAIMRVPPILRGRVDNTNLANGDASRATADTETFGPERDLFDAKMNADFLPAMGIRLWSFRSQAPDPLDYERAKILASTADAKKRQFLSDNEWRREFGDALNIDLPPRDPVPVTDEDATK